MTEPLEDLKNRLRKRYLGCAGIHALGVSEADKAIRIYVRSDTTADRTAVLQAIEKDAAPYRVMVVEEQPPTLTQNRNA
jgi:hypothetical protein